MKFNDVQLADIRLFAALTEAGSLTAAAAFLNVPSSSASRSLKRLETWVGRSLLDRSTKLLKLTDEGSNFLPSARKMLFNQDQLVAELHSRGPRNLSGRLSISSPHNFGCSQISPFIADFLALNPAIDITLTLYNPRVDLLGDKADVTVHMGDVDDDGLVTRFLATEPTMLCASPAYLSANGYPARLEDLTSHNLLTVSSASQSTAMLLPCRSQTHKIAGNIALRSNEPETLIAAAMRGVGIAHVPASLIARNLETGALVAVLPDLDLLARSINAAYVLHGPQSHKARVFLDFLIDRIDAPSENGNKRRLRSSDWPQRLQFPRIDLGATCRDAR